MRRHFLGFVFQGYNLLARVSALENVELPLVYRGVRSGERRKLALQALTRVGLSDRAHHDPSELSGGQQQRVAIARAIVGTPSVLVADEPTGNLDSATSVEVMDLLTALNRDDGITIIMVTHEPDMAEFAHRVVRFRDGHIETESANQGALIMVIEMVRLATQMIFRNALRSFLTVLGVVIGVASGYPDGYARSGKRPRVSPPMCKAGQQPDNGHARRGYGRRPDRGGRPLFARRCSSH